MRARQQGFVAARIFCGDLSMPLAASPHLALCMAHEQDLQHRVLKAAKMTPMIVNCKFSSMVVKRSDLGAEAWQPADGPPIKVKQYFTAWFAEAHSHELHNDDLTEKAIGERTVDHRSTNPSGPVLAGCLPLTHHRIVRMHCCSMASAKASFQPPTMTAAAAAPHAGPACPLCDMKWLNSGTWQAPWR